MSNLKPTIGLDLPGKANVLGVGIHNLNLPLTVELMEAAIENKQQGYICVTDVHSIIEAQDNSAYLSVLNNSFLTVPDGRPAVWIGRIQGFGGMDQVPGPELILKFCECSARRGYTHFIYGGEPGVAEHLKRVLSERYPGLNVVGTYSPPFRPLTEAEERDLAEIFKRLRPDVTWIGLGAPKQEFFMAHHVGSLDTILMVGVGAAFDMHTGKIKDAPRWLKPFGLSWLHRLIQEPKRLWRRYLHCIPRFVLSTMLQISGLKKYEVKSQVSDPSRNISRATT